MSPMQVQRKILVAQADMNTNRLDMYILRSPCPARRCMDDVLAWPFATHHQLPLVPFLPNLASFGLGVPLCHSLPIDDLPNVLQVLWLNIFVLQVESMLPANPMPKPE